MIELTLFVLLNNVSNDFCAYRNKEYDVLKSVLLAYADSNAKYGPANVKKVIEKSEFIQEAAIASVLTKCPDKL